MNLTQLKTDDGVRRAVIDAVAVESKFSNDSEPDIHAVTAANDNQKPAPFTGSDTTSNVNPSLSASTTTNKLPVQYTDPVLTTFSLEEADLRALQKESEKTDKLAAGNRLYKRAHKLLLEVLERHGSEEWVDGLQAKESELSDSELSDADSDVWEVAYDLFVGLVKIG